MIVGVDEVGRGCLAGPVCVAAVLLGEHSVEGLTDSKMLTSKKRLHLSRLIKEQALGIGIGWISAKAIDQIGISVALKLAATTAVRQINRNYDQIIIDGTIRLVDDPRVILMKKADLLIESVSAASIIAKVCRDQYMTYVDGLFPGYGFATHVGYGTAKHLSSLQNLGPSPVHRLSFAPLNTAPIKRSPIALTPGSLAEQKAAAYLRDNKYKIIEQNWKTKWCEIDMVVLKNDVLHFVESKYRASGRSGEGMAHVTPAKRRQMRFAAELYIKQKKWVGDATLSAIEISGPDFSVTGWLPDIDAV